MLKIEDIKKSNFEEEGRFLTFWIKSNKSNEKDKIKELYLFIEKYGDFEEVCGDSEEEQYAIIDIDYCHGEMADLKKEMKENVKRFNKEV